MATSKDIVCIRTDDDEEYFQIVGTKEYGMGIETVANICEVSEVKIIELLGRCDADETKWPELEPLRFGGWRLAEDMAIISDAAFVQILRYFVRRTYNPAAYQALNAHYHLEMGFPARELSEEDLMSYRLTATIRPFNKRDD